MLFGLKILSQESDDICANNSCQYDICDIYGKHTLIRRLKFEGTSTPCSEVFVDQASEQRSLVPLDCKVQGKSEPARTKTYRKYKMRE